MKKQQMVSQLMQRVSLIATCEEFGKLLDLTLQLLLDTTQATDGTLSLYEPPNNHLITKTTHGTHYPILNPEVHALLQQELATYSHQLMQPVFVADIDKEPSLPHLATHIQQNGNGKPAGVWFLPLVSPKSERPLGVVQIFTSSPPPPDNSTQELVSMLCPLLATQIAQAQRLHDTHRRADRLLNLVEIMSCMATTLESTQLLDDIMTYAKNLLDVETTSIWLKDDATGDMKLHIATGSSTGEDIWVPAGQGIIGHVISTGVSVVVNDVSQDTHFYKQVDHLLDFKTRTILCVPLQAPRIEPRGSGVDNAPKETIIGGAQALNKRGGKPFDDEDRVLFELFASQAATILQILWLYEATSTAQRERAAAEEASRARSVFLSNMSHELRTPLNAIIGYSELLAEDIQELGLEDLLADLQKIRSSGSHLLSIINDILDISKIEAGKMDVYNEPFAIATLVDYVARTIEPAMTKKGNIFEIEIAEDVGVMHSDLGKVRQSLANLLNNANKFTDYGKVTLTVERLLFEDTPQAIRSIYQASGDNAAIQQTAYIVFRVSDTGIGMSPEQMRNIFDAFSQGDESSTRKYGGTGLGLAITRKFCTMLGGDIMVQSTPGQGSIFTIWLPEHMTSLDEEAEE